jgi:hypothetical protein
MHATLFILLLRQLTVNSSSFHSPPLVSNSINTSEHPPAAELPGELCSDWFSFSSSQRMNFFGTKKVDPIEQAKEWKRNLARESRKLDRDILNLQRAEKRAMKECKIYAKKVSDSFYLKLTTS